MSNQKPIKIF